MLKFFGVMITGGSPLTQFFGTAEKPVLEEKFQVLFTNKKGLHNFLSLLFCKILGLWWHGIHQIYAD